jgi:hypothetical protein
MMMGVWEDAVACNFLLRQDSNPSLRDIVAKLADVASLIKGTISSWAVSIES